MACYSHPNSVIKVRTHREAVRFTLEWTIENFKTFRKETDTMYGAGIMLAELGLDEYQGRLCIGIRPCHKVDTDSMEQTFLGVFLFLKLSDMDQKADMHNTSDIQDNESTLGAIEQNIPFEASARIITGKAAQEQIWIAEDLEVNVLSSAIGEWGWNKAINHDDLFGLDGTPAWLKDDCITVSYDVVIYKHPQSIQIDRTVVSDAAQYYPDFVERQLKWLGGQQPGKCTDLDFVLQSSDGKTFETSRWILMAHSPVFEAMFLENSKKTKASPCELADVDGETMDVMLNYLYGCSMEKINRGNAEKVLIMADKYQLTDLRHACAELLANNVPVDKAVHLLVLASQRGLENLKAAALTVMPKNMATVLKNGALEEVLQADPSLVQTIMEHCSKQVRATDEP